MRFILWALTIVTACCVVIAATDSHHPAADLLSNFYWHFVVVAALISIFAVVSKTWRIAFAAFLLGAFSYYQTQQFDVAAPESQVRETGAKIYRFVTINMWGRADNTARVVSFLEMTQPDFVLLQEVNASDWGQISKLQDIYPHRGFCAHPLCRIVILSKYQWTDFQEGREAHYHLPKIDVQFGEDLGGLRLVGIHSARPHYRFEGQRAQLTSLATELARISQPSIVAGDFNAAAFANPMRALSTMSGFAHAGPYLTSWPKRTRHFDDFALPITQFGLDQFYVNSKIRVIHVERGPDLGSDHLPMILDFAVRP